MKKFLIYLLLVSMCSGSEESVSTSIEEDLLLLQSTLRIHQDYIHPTFF